MHCRWNCSSALLHHNKGTFESNNHKKTTVCKVCKNTKNEQIKDSKLKCLVYIIFVILLLTSVLVLSQPNPQTNMLNVHRRGGSRHDGLIRPEVVFAPQGEPHSTTYSDGFIYLLFQHQILSPIHLSFIQRGSCPHLYHVCCCFVRRDSQIELRQREGESC